MAETRYIEVYDGINPEPIERIPYEISEEELQLEQVKNEVKEVNDNALNAYLHYDSLTLAQKDIVLKALLGDFISRNRGNYIPS